MTKKPTTRAAKFIIRKFPAGTRVASIGGTPARRVAYGIVNRVIPMTNAQGGVIVVDWDNGRTSRHGAMSLEVVQPGEES